MGAREGSRTSREPPDDRPGPGARRHEPIRKGKTISEIARDALEREQQYWSAAPARLDVWLLRGGDAGLAGRPMVDRQVVQEHCRVIRAVALIEDRQEQECVPAVIGVEARKILVAPP